MLPSKFGVNWPFSSGEAKNRFSKWQPRRPSGILDQYDFSYFDLQVTPMLRIVSRPSFFFVSGEEAKIDFQDGGHLGVPHRNDFSYFLSASYPNASYQVSCLLALCFRGSKK